MLKIERSITIDLPIEAAYEYLADPRHFAAIWPSVVEIKDVQPLPTGGYTFYHVCSMGGLRFEGWAETAELVPQSRIVYQLTSGKDEGTMTFAFEPVGKATKVSLALAGTIPVPLIDKLPEPALKLLLGLELDYVLGYLKTVLPHVAKTPTIR